MTVQNILRTLAPHKRVSRVHLYRYLKALKIGPVGAVNQRPQQYPGDTPQRILNYLGHVITLPELREVRRRARARRKEAA